ncbi:uncharacterized protein LOC108735934 [Agrilus planipennis]|uniref:Uncharacterized protein LOC108735934 n=1 Tax=Agrilus planipennis TaxID=224129 RepID=A0A7F5QVZ7_AGRPL|nr:uncharacterized protein LOC108735934 [Agrilus planipennis]
MALRGEISSLTMKNTIFQDNYNIDRRWCFSENESITKNELLNIGDIIEETNIKKKVEDNSYVSEIKLIDRAWRFSEKEDNRKTELLKSDDTIRETVFIKKEALIDNCTSEGDVNKETNIKREVENDKLASESGFIDKTWGFSKKEDSRKTDPLKSDIIEKEVLDNISAVHAEVKEKAFKCKTCGQKFTRKYLHGITEKAELQRVYTRCNKEQATLTSGHMTTCARVSAVFVDVAIHI